LYIHQVVGVVHHLVTINNIVVLHLLYRAMRQEQRLRLGDQAVVAVFLVVVWADHRADQVLIQEKQFQYQQVGAMTYV
jgi:hypothetical protein